jgi:NAD(P)-dependent dehydrogenase (short-subunit alcohol dehydrogenase family)
MVTIITGASRGIGKAIAKELSGELILIDSNNCDLQYKNNVSDYLESYEGILSDAEHINIILCAARIGKANNLSLNEVEGLFGINLIGNLAVIKFCIQFQKRMRIIWFAGGGAAFAFPEFFGYSLSKVAVVKAVENLALILKNTTIIALAPGAVETDMLQKTIEAGINVKTRTDLKDIIKFVNKFISDESTKLNGMFIHIRDDIKNIPDKKDIFKLRRVNV